MTVRLALCSEHPYSTTKQLTSCHRRYYYFICILASVCCDFRGIGRLSDIRNHSRSYVFRVLYRDYMTPSIHEIKCRKTSGYQRVNPYLGVIDSLWFVVKCACYHVVEVESRIVDDRCHRMNISDIVERNVDLFKQLNRTPELEPSNRF